MKTDFKTKADSQQPSLWDDVARHYSDRPDKGETEIAAELGSLLASLGVPDGSTLLEAGSGSGHISSFLASKGYKTTLLDFSKVALKKSENLYKKNNLGGNFVHSDLFEISAESVGTHDVVWNSGVLEHFDGWQVIDAMQKMASVARRFVIILVPNPKSSAYMDFRKKALEEGAWQWGLEILRESLGDLALLSGLEVVEERFAGISHLKYFERFVGPAGDGDGDGDGNNSSSSGPDGEVELADDQKYLKVIVARPVHTKLDLASKIDLLLRVFRNDSAVLRQTYYYDITILMERLKSLGIRADEDKVLLAQLKSDLSYAEYAASVLEEGLLAQKKANSELAETNTNLSGKNSGLRNDLFAIVEGLLAQKKANSELAGENFGLRNSLDYERQRVDTLLNTKTWKLTKLYEKKFQGNLAGKIIEGLVDLVLRGRDGSGEKEEEEEKEKGGKAAAATPRGPQKTRRQKTLDEIESILGMHKDAKGIVVYPPAIDWNIPLLQRPQHMASCLAKNNWLYFYCTTNAYDKVSGFERLSENLYLTDRFDELVEKLDSFFVFVHSAHPTLTIPQIKGLEKKASLIYDYLDEIHPDVSGLKPRDVLDRHNYMMKNSRAVVATAKKLFSDVTKLRRQNVYLLPNAVDYEHFHRPPDPKAVPKEIRAIRDSSGGPILGYFGAIARWFDYGLVKKIAGARPDWNIVLIGWDYDNTVGSSGIDRFENIHYLGIKEYGILPDYAAWFDVCLLPFLLNDITNSTSPIKLFEYMALGKPVVATPIREVRNYRSPLVAEGADEFIEKIDRALVLRDDQAYLDLVDREAQDNTWKKRFDDLDRIMQSLLKG